MVELGEEHIAAKIKAEKPQYDLKLESVPLDNNVLKTLLL